MCWAVGVSLLGWIFKEFDSVWMREEISLESSLKAEALGVCTGWRCCLRHLHSIWRPVRNKGKQGGPSALAPAAPKGDPAVVATLRMIQRKDEAPTTPNSGFLINKSWGGRGWTFLPRFETSVSCCCLCGPGQASFSEFYCVLDSSFVKQVLLVPRIRSSQDSDWHIVTKLVLLLVPWQFLLLIIGWFFNDRGFETGWLG